MYTPEERYTYTERTGPTPDTCGGHAGYALCVRRLRSSAYIAHTVRVRMSSEHAVNEGVLNESLARTAFFY